MPFRRRAKKPTPDELRPIQGVTWSKDADNKAPQFSDSELARQVAQGESWVFDWMDRVCEPDGTVIADSIMELARKLRAMGGLMDGYVDWKYMPNTGSALAAQVRATP